MSRKKQSATQIADGENVLMIAVPVVPLDETVYRSPVINLKLTPKQADALRVLYDALYERDSRLNNGHHVDTPYDAVRWLLDQISNEMPTHSAA